MRTCPQCGAAEPDEAQWCGKCYLPFAPSPSVAAFNSVVVPGELRAPVAVPAPAAPLAPAAVAPPVAPYAPPVAPYAPPVAPHFAPPAPLPPPPPQWGTAAPVVGMGWQPPAGTAPPWQPPGPVSDPVAEGRLLSGRALALVAIAIGLGGVYQLVGYALSRDSHINEATLIRYVIVLTLAFYAIVAVLIVSQITPKVRLRWGEGSRVVRIAIGASIGFAGGGLLVAGASAVEHQLSSDPRIVTLMSAGDASHVIVAALIACAAAPLVEETLFRGLLLESLRHYNGRMAVFVSAMCFAVWHFNKRALVYYTLMGLVLGGVYLWRGLAASMATHFGFNGALAIAAIFIVLGPSHAYDVEGLQLTAPSGWSKVPTESTTDEFSGGGGLELLLQGPDGSGLGVFTFHNSAPFDPTTVEQRLATTDLPLPPGSSFDAGSVHEVTLPTVGAAVEADFSYQSNRGELVLFTSNGTDFVITFINGGNAKADSDFTKMLGSLQPSTVAPQAS